MTAADIPVVDRIGELVHPNFPEDIAVMENRFALFPAGCFVADNEDEALGYAISHPAVVGRPAPLNHVLPALDPKANCLFLHDIALTPSSRGQGLGQSIVPMLTKVARAHRLHRIGLVSVNNSRAFWEAQGFRIHLGDAMLKAKLATYEKTAALMVLEIV
jgi:GNAT superfamily N-acetyltransferase